MKKFYMTMVAMLCSVAAMAQTSTISVEDVDAVNDGKTTSYVEVLLNESTPGGVVSATSFRIALPAGVSIAKYYSEDDEEYLDDITSPAKKSSHTLDVRPTSNENELQISVYGTAYFKTSTNVLAKIGIVVAESVAKGTYELKFSAISNSDPLGNVVNPQDDFTAVLNVDGTGINSINADDVNAPIYNVAGQRVSKAQKGIFIQNGKKIAVK